MSNKPTHRILFSRTIIDGEGNDTLGNAREIGTVWPREGKSAILRLDHIPLELTRHQGVLFLSEITSKADKA